MEILSYIGIALLAIGIWQIFMHGIQSQKIRNISLTLGMILAFVGNWHTGLFFMFMFGSWEILRHILDFPSYCRHFFDSYRLSAFYRRYFPASRRSYFPASHRGYFPVSYHRYFPLVVPFLIAYAALVAILLRQFGFEDYIWWYFIFSAFVFWLNHRGMSFEKEMESPSINDTIRHHIASACIHLAMVTFTFFYLV